MRKYENFSPLHVVSYLRIPSFKLFSPVSDEELTSVIKSMSKKFCDLDPIPTKLLLNCLPELLPLISFIVNESLSKGVFPQQLKEALVRPSLKKPSLDSEYLSNYRPISNLSFLSKIIEKCVSLQLVKFLEDNNLLSKFQSGYRKHHSCETATTRIHNDILVTIDKRSKVVLLLLDLSAAFDTVNHQRLLKKLQFSYGIKGVTLEWIRSYLQSRSFSVKVKDSCSPETVLEVGVPQGSILGPLLFILYTKDLEHIASKYNCKIHLYADDTQLYFTFESGDESNLEITLARCMADIKSWMVVNFLQLNPSKTEVIIISSKHDQSSSPTELKISNLHNAHVVNQTVKSLGFYLDSSLSMSDQITSVVQACNIQIRNLWFIASKLTYDLKIQLVHALVLSRLDYQGAGKRPRQCCQPNGGRGPEGPEDKGHGHSRARRAREWPKHASPRARRARGRAKPSARFGACQCFYMFFTIQPKIAIFMALFRSLNDGQNA